jgi:hypothetical protein
VPVEKKAVRFNEKPKEETKRAPVAVSEDLGIGT